MRNLIEPEPGEPKIEEVIVTAIGQACEQADKFDHFSAQAGADRQPGISTKLHLERPVLTDLPVVTVGRLSLVQRRRPFTARHFRALKALGVTVRKTIDTVVATTCIMDGYTLLHSDRDFEPFVAHLGLRSVSRKSQA